MEIHREKIQTDSYNKIAISQLESVKKEPALQELIEKGLIPLEIDEYKKTVYIYALISRINDTKKKEYKTKVVIQSYDERYITQVNSAKNKIDLFAKFDNAFLLHDPTAKPKATPKAKAKE